MKPKVIKKDVNFLFWWEKCICEKRVLSILCGFYDNHPGWWSCCFFRVAICIKMGSGNLKMELMKRVWRKEFFCWWRLEDGRKAHRMLLEKPEGRWLTSWLRNKRSSFKKRKIVYQNVWAREIPRRFSRPSQTVNNLKDVQCLSAQEKKPLMFLLAAEVSIKFKCWWNPPVDTTDYRLFLGSVNVLWAIVNKV